jgi:hypothetical protein
MSRKRLSSKKTREVICLPHLNAKLVVISFITHDLKHFLGVDGLQVVSESTA